jgi:dolichol-phosphate mannosyltransferase
MKAVVVMPTYNERDNLARLLPALLGVFKGLPHDCHVLVVDDSSPDGTATVVRDIASTHPNIHLNEGIKKGLGAAYVRGIRQALDEMGADAVIGMDADLSHNPADVPRLLAALDQGADFVIGSRYVAGGSTPSNWALLRRLNSRYGNLVARVVVGLDVRDCTSGFRAIRASILRAMDLSSINVSGYAFLVALLYEATLRGAKVHEVPIAFTDRTAGTSKLGLRDIREFILSALWLRFRSSAVFIKFLAVGASGVLVNLGAFTLLLAAGINKFIASPIAIELSILSNFALNNAWTFRSRNTNSGIHVKGLKYNIVSLVALALSFGTFAGLSVLFPKASPQLLQFIGIVPATMVNYLLNSYWTFRDRPRK